jgi:hypothetical protein
MDPGEEYERFMGGAAPTTANGALQNSQGRWQGGDTAWTLALVGAVLEPLNQTFRDFPNIPIVPGGSTIGADVPSFHAKNVFEGAWPGADSAHEAAKDMRVDS